VAYSEPQQHPPSRETESELISPSQLLTKEFLGTRPCAIRRSFLLVSCTRVRIGLDPSSASLVDGRLSAWMVSLTFLLQVP
jgi:hypothetical protein